jgi:hypothetical protein
VGYRVNELEIIPHLPLSNFKISKSKPKDKPYKLYDSLGLFLAPILLLIAADVRHQIDRSTLEAILGNVGH